MAIDWEAKVGAPTVKVFGEAALYVPAETGAAPYVVTGVFDESYQDITIIDPQADTAEGRPVIGINSRQGIGKPEWAQDDRVVTGIVVADDGSYTIPISARTWMVKNAEPDSKGHIMLALNKAAAYTP